MSSFILLVNIIYIQLFCHVKSQWEQIWFDDMEQKGTWTTNYYTYWGISNPGCFTGTCLATHTGSGGWSSVYRSTSISGYSSLRLQFDLSADDKHKAEVYYSYTSSSSKILIQTFSAPNYKEYPSQIVNLPAPTSSTLWIWLYCDNTDAGSYVECFWDNVYLQGIPGTVSTDEPTTFPSKSPSKYPTKSPTEMPSKDPTVSPSDPPSSTPSQQPTASPSADPTANPSNNPTVSPSNNPSRTPTRSPSGHPSISPSGVPTASPSDDPTASPSA
eukprot:406132_1